MQKKLTLRLEENLIQRVKLYSKKRGKSISRIVADYFSLLDRKPSQKAPALTPTVQSPKGVLKGSRAGKQDYRRYLEKKYL